MERRGWGGDIESLASSSGLRELDLKQGCLSTFMQACRFPRMALDHITVVAAERRRQRSSCGWLHHEPPESTLLKTDRLGAVHSKPVTQLC